MAIRKRRKVRPKKISPKLEIEHVALDDIVPHPQNVRLHPEANIQAIIRSLDAFGQRTPIVIGRTEHEGKPCILKGCGTWEAMKRRGDEFVQVVRVDHLTEAQEVAYAIADNKTSDTSQFDFESLADVMRYLQEEEVDLAVTGFEDFERQPLLEARFNVDPVSDGKHSAETKFVMKFNPEEGIMVEQAIARAVAVGIATNKDNRERILSLICEYFLANTKAKKKPLRKAR